MIKKLNILIALGVLAFILTSCKDNAVTPVNPPPSADTSIYNWDSTLFIGYGFSIAYIADSADIYFNEYYGGFFYYDGKTLTQISLGYPFFPSVYAGFNKNNIFVGGGNAAYGDPILKQVKNGSLSNTYVIQGDSGVEIKDILPEGTDKCWLSTVQNNRIYHFDNGTFKKYSLDSGVIQGTFYRDNSGQLFVFGRKYHGSTPDTTDVIYYKFTGDAFQMFGSDTVDFNTYFVLHRCGDDILRSGNNSIYYFNGNSWEECLHKTDFEPENFTGKSKDDLVCIGHLPKIYSFKNNIWAQEWHIIPFYYSGNTSMFTCGDNVYLTTYGSNYSYSTLFLKGTLKQKGGK